MVSDDITYALRTKNLKNYFNLYSIFAAILGCSLMDIDTFIARNMIVVSVAREHDLSAMPIIYNFAADKSSSSWIFFFWWVDSFSSFFHIIKVAFATHSETLVELSIDAKSFIISISSLRSCRFILINSHPICPSQILSLIIFCHFFEACHDSMILWTPYFDLPPQRW